MSQQKCTIQILWGYWMFYTKKWWEHVDYCMDGFLTADDGEITNPELIDFHGTFGPCRESYTPLDKPQWFWQARSAFRLGGVRFTVIGDDDTVVNFHSRTIDFSFTIGEIRSTSRISHRIGQHYSPMFVHAFVDGSDANLDSPADIAKLTAETGKYCALHHGSEFSGHIRRWHRADWAWVSPDQPAEIKIDQPKWTPVDGGGRRVLRATIPCIAAVPESSPACDREHLKFYKIRYHMDPDQAPDGLVELAHVVTLPYKVIVNGKQIADGNQYFPKIRRFPLVQEIVVDIPEDALTEESNTLRIENDSADGYILIGRMYLQEAHEYDFQVTSCPKWVILGEQFEIVLNCRTAVSDLKVQLPDSITASTELPTTLDAGKHRLAFVASEPLAGAVITFSAGSLTKQAHIEQVIAATGEKMTMRLGVETLNISAQTPGVFEKAIDMLRDGQVGEYLIFRNRSSESDSMTLDQAAELSKLCKQRKIYHCLDVHLDHDKLTVMAENGGQYFLGAHIAERDGNLFGNNLFGNYDWQVTPADPAGRTMKTARDDHVAFLANLLKVHSKDGEFHTDAMASVLGCDYFYRAGCDLLVVQLYKSNNTLLLSDIRGASRTHGKDVWGVYIAEGAHLQPETDAMLRMWKLALNLCYACGASYANDEETIWGNVHEHQYSFSDRFPRTRRDIMRRVNHYAKAHPLSSVPIVKQALLVGNNSCDVTDGLEGWDNQPSVWGNFGDRSDSRWASSRPEHGLRYLDVFFPGVRLQSLNHSPSRTRQFYCGSPNGELELISIDAPADVLAQFKLLLLLGWNTMDQSSYDGLIGYVQSGGTLFMAIPQMMTNQSRNFLSGEEPLNLINAGDFSDLFGVKVTGPGEEIQWIRPIDGAGLGLAHHYEVNNSYGPPIDPAVRAMQCDIIDAEVIVTDGATGAPILIRRKLGKGNAYLLLSDEYPGNSRLSWFMTELVRGLSENVPCDVNLGDPTGDVYYTVRRENNGELVRVHLLNTDWTEADNTRHCSLKLGDAELPLEIVEGCISEVVWFGDLAAMVINERTFIQSIDKSASGYSVAVSGSGAGEVLVRRLDDKSTGSAIFEGTPANTADKDGWMVVSFDFGERSVGVVSIATA